MEVLLGLLAFGYVLGLPIALVVLLVGQSRLKRRVAGLEASLSTPGAAAQVFAPAAEAALRPVEASTDAAEPKPVLPAVPTADLAGTPTVVPATAPAGAEQESPDQDRPLVMRRDRLSQLGAWLSGNWVYVVSAVSLAAAGVFFVQYGIENGLLPPAARVAFAVLFGLALIGGGEWLRRRQRGEEDATAHLPAVFSGAGLVSIFAGIVAGRLLYGLYGPELTFLGLAATATLAIGLGWRNEPFLVAVGLIGASAAPFLVGSDGGAPAWLYGYYGLVAVIGLAVDALRRWAWVSVLALLLGFGFGWLMLVAGAGTAGWTALLTGLVFAAIILPPLAAVPGHEAPAALPWLMAQGRAPWPVFPVRLAVGATLATSVLLALSVGDTTASSWLAFLALGLLALALLLWADRAPGLDDLALFPALAFLARLFLEATDGPLGQAFLSQAFGLRPPETSPPWTVTVLLALAVCIGLAAAQRALAGQRHRLAFGIGAVAFAPVATLVLELYWHPAIVLGPYLWALQVMVVAAVMVWLAMRFAARDGADHRRLAYATIAALSLIALALFIATSGQALTLALAVLLLATAALDRRFDLRELGAFAQLGVAVIGWRLTFDPGADWALNAPLLPVLAVYIGAILAAAGSLALLRPLDRVMAKGVLESGAAGFSALFTNVQIARALGYTGLTDWSGDALDLTLNAMPWLILMLVQLYRMPLGGPLRRLRIALAAIAGAIAGLGLLGAALPANPLLGDGFIFAIQEIRGPLVFDTLMVTYLLPGLLLLGALRVIPGLPRWLVLVFLGSGILLAALYVGLEIRRFWRGDILSVDGVTQPELYSYTLAMMLTGAVLLYQAIARRSAGLRRIAMALIALTVAKVFLIDASGLTGLTRVVSFLGLGLSLAGLAWLNRWAGAQADDRGEKPE